jgi:hypothetical protein
MVQQELKDSFLSDYNDLFSKVDAIVTDIGSKYIKKIRHYLQNLIMSCTSAKHGTGIN